jgi:hypothetical protein
MAKSRFLFATGVVKPPVSLAASCGKLSIWIPHSFLRAAIARRIWNATEPSMMVVRIRIRHLPLPFSNALISSTGKFLSEK